MNRLMMLMMFLQFDLGFVRWQLTAQSNGQQ